MKLLNLLFLETMVFVQYSYSSIGLIFPVSNYGGYPNDNIDDSNATLTAVYFATLNGSNNIVLFQSGAYDFTQTIYISNAINLTIMGQGMQQTLLVGHSSAGLFSANLCQGLKITSLTIDYDSLAFTAGYVVSVNASYLDVQIVPPHQADINQQVGAILRYDPTLMRPAIGSQAYEIYQTPPSNANTSLISNNVLRIPLVSPSLFAVGDAIVARYVFTNHVLYARNTTDLTVQSITIYTGWYMGLFTLRVRRLNLIDYHVKRYNGRWMSTPADCMHFKDSRDYVNVFDSSCEAQGDDGLNIQAFYYSVQQIINGSALIIEEHNWLDTLNIGIGTRVEFSFNQQPFSVYLTATVTSLSIYSSNSQLLTFTNPINVSVGDWVCVADTPSLTIRNLTVTNNRARGVLLETRNILLTNSLFNGTSGPAVLFQPSLYWYEGPATNNVSLEQNIYINCNEGIAREKGVIVFLPYPVQLIPVLYNVQVKSSTFFNGKYSGDMIQSANGENIFITENYFDMHNGTSLIILCNSKNISAFNNSVVNSSSSINQYYTYDTSSPCLTNLSSSIDLPMSAFNSTFPPPVIITNSFVQPNGNTMFATTSSNAKDAFGYTAITIVLSQLFVLTAGKYL